VLLLRAHAENGIVQGSKLVTLVIFLAGIASGIWGGITWHCGRGVSMGNG